MEGQAEYLRVPYADFNVVKLSNTDNLYEKDFILLTDIFPTRMGQMLHSCRDFNTRSFNTIAIFGAGPSRVNDCLQC